MLASPQATITASDDTICEHQYIFFHAVTDDPFLEYVWHLPGAIPDSATQTDPIIQYLTPGVYPVYAVLKNLFGTDTAYLSHDIVVLNCTTGLPSLTKAEPEIVYPNPFRDFFIVRQKNIIAQQIDVYDMHGNIATLEMEKQNSGEVMVRVRTDHHIICRKMIKL
jgi:hypothetical protein